MTDHSGKKREGCFFFFSFLKNDKKNQLEGKLQDIRCRLSTQRQEIESTNKSRELRIAEITHLQQQLQVRKRSLILFLALHFDHLSCINILSKLVTIYDVLFLVHKELLSIICHSFK